MIQFNNNVWVICIDHFILMVTNHTYSVDYNVHDDNGKNSYDIYDT